MATAKIIREAVDELCAPLFSTEWGKRLSLATLGVSACLLLFMVSCVFMDWYLNILTFKPAQSVASVTEGNLTELVAQIPNGHLFGKYGALQNAHIPITSLQIELTGIIEDPTENLSRVIISEKGKPGKVYRPGDVLESGVRIYSITKEGIVLENGGQLEKLPLRRQPLIFQKPGTIKSSESKTEEH